MHGTFNTNILANVDLVKKQGSSYLIEGWIATKNGQDIQDILITGGESLSPKLSKRPDVSEFYQGSVDATGFSLDLPLSEIHSNISIVVNGNKIDSVLSFNKWITASSGFNRTSKDLIVVDDFYADPDLVREYAMNNLTFKPSGYHKGERSDGRYILDGTKEKLEEIIGKEIINWNHGGYANGVFQFCTADQPIVYHVDQQMYAAMVYLTPDAPPNTGTSMYRSKVTGISSFPGQETRMGQEYVDTFRGNSNEMNFYDGTHFEKIDDLGNVYNRLVIFNSSQIHAATEYFGDAIDNARFFHMFFFDVAE